MANNKSNEVKKKITSKKTTAKKEKKPKKINDNLMILSIIIIVLVVLGVLLIVFRDNPNSYTITYYDGGTSGNLFKIYIDENNTITVNKETNCNKETCIEDNTVNVYEVDFSEKNKKAFKNFLKKELSREAKNNIKLNSLQMKEYHYNVLSSVVLQDELIFDKVIKNK